MALRNHRSLRLSTVGGLLLSLAAAKTQALQPIDKFLEGARRSHFDNREAAATTRQRSAESEVASQRLYPTFSATGSYTRNQYEVAVAFPVDGTAQRIVIQPQDQLDGNLTLSLPLIDVAAWRRISAANAVTESSEANERATQQDVETQVMRSYYQLLGQEAVLEAARRTRAVADKNLKLIQDKLAGGTASELDVQRARAEIARAEGDIASADLAVVNARRALATATSIEPEPATEFLNDDLHEEAPLPSWLGGAAQNPRVAVAQSARRAAEKTADAAEAAWFPTLAASASERLTNATGFSGHSAVYLIQATLSWRFDASIPSNVRAQTAAAGVNAIRAERAARAVEDTIYQAWHQVRAAIEKSRAARVQVGASALAAELANDRYSVGAATQLEVVQAQQETFRAEVARIQADTELAYARAALRVSSGRFGERDKP